MRIIFSTEKDSFTVIETDKVNITGTMAVFADCEGTSYKARYSEIPAKDIVRLYTEGNLNLLEADITIEKNILSKEKNDSFFEEPGIINPPCAIVDIMDDSNDIFVYDVHEIVNVFGDDVDGKCDRYHYVKDNNYFEVDENITVTFQKEEFQYPRPFPSVEAALEYLDENGLRRQ